MAQVMENTVPLLLTTQQASKYLAGRDVFDGKPISTRAFLQFAEFHGIKPNVETKSTSQRNGTEFVRFNRQWSKLAIDEALKGSVA